MAAGSAGAAFPGQNGRIAFDRDTGGDDEIFTMSGHGQNQVPLTDNDLSDRNPVYSANARRIGSVSG